MPAFEPRAGWLGKGWIAGNSGCRRPVLLVAPVLMTAGIEVGLEEIRVQNEIKRRSTVFPATVAESLPGEREPPP